MLTAIRACILVILGQLRCVKFDEMKYSLGGNTHL